MSPSAVESANPIAIENAEKIFIGFADNMLRGGREACPVTNPSSHGDPMPEVHTAMRAEFQSAVGGLEFEPGANPGLSAAATWSSPVRRLQSAKDQAPHNAQVLGMSVVRVAFRPRQRADQRCPALARTNPCRASPRNAGHGRRVVQAQRTMVAVKLGCCRKAPHFQEDENRLLVTAYEDRNPRIG